MNSEFSYETLSIGNQVYVGPRAYFRSTHGQIIIGSHVMFGPSVYILGGNHITDRVGMHMIEVKKKSDHIDASIVVEDDTWIGARATILTGVTIGEGAIVAAGSVVTRNVPPYEIHAGVPNRKIGERFSAEKLKVHRQSLQDKHV